MNHVGISCGFHDAALSAIDSGGNILFAGHSERYSDKKHDSAIHDDLVIDALGYVDGDYVLNYYERPVAKYLRRLRAGEGPPLATLRAKNIIGPSAMRLFDNKKITTHDHHRSHCAAGFQTSRFRRATVVVIDAIGEWDTATIWAAEYDNDNRAQYRLLWRQTYPDSVGLFYSAMTERVGLRPLDEEYILMGMSAWTRENAKITDRMSSYAVASYRDTTFNLNFHAGVDDHEFVDCDDFEIARATQTVTERLIEQVMSRARAFGWSDNLVYGGGVALNCVANRLLGKFFNNIWIMPCPGDAGSSLGAAALSYGGQLQWHSAYLGYEIRGQYPVQSALNHLLNDQIVGVASGRAEWGPRALGNRSLLADPRGHDIKDRVNVIKHRQQFRPFAPVILEEFVDEYFVMPPGWPTCEYMQTIAQCRAPHLFPAICHVDATSRVQTVAQNSNSGIRRLLEAWYTKTGCPMLLNTSLNIRNRPVVNTAADAREFQKLYGVTVLT